MDLLLLALVASIIGATLLVWHRRGGPSWTFSLGGFFFILGRLTITAFCAFVCLHLLSRVDEMDGSSLLINGLPAILVFGIGAWSAFVVALYVYNDAFGGLEQETTQASQDPPRS